MDYNKMSYEELVEQLKGNFLLMHLCTCKENFIKYSENICVLQDLLLEKNKEYFNKHFGEKLTCERCGEQNETVKTCTDPYVEEIYGERTLVQLCDECYKESLYDI